MQSAPLSDSAMSRKKAVSLPERLKTAIRNRRVFHAYLFEGEHDQTDAMAEAFAAAVLCERQNGEACGRCVSCRQIKDSVSPFIVKVSTLEEKPAELGEEKKGGRKAKPKDSGKIKDGQIEDVISRSRGTSLSSSRVITLIDRADTITPRGQNRLLKTLEEPPEGVTIVLMTENAEGLLETIRSRCQLVHPDLAEEDASDVTDAFTKRAVAAAAKLLRGAPAVDLWKEMDYFADSREKAMRFAETAMLVCRDAAVLKQTGRRDLIVLKNYENIIRETADAVSNDICIKAAGCCDRALRDLKAVVSMKHALRYMMFDIQLLHGERK